MFNSLYSYLKKFLFIVLLLGAVLPLSPDGFPWDDPENRGDRAVAERYAQWAKDAVDQGRWSEALAGLKRATDFADVSSDISFLLALVLSHENKPRQGILEALEMALRVDRWNLYESEDARFLKTEHLIALGAYYEALTELSKVGKSLREAVLTLKALVFYRPVDFRGYMAETLDRYPRESGPVRIFFSFLKAEDAAGRNPDRDDLELLDLVIRRLPVLLPNDPELAWMAAPYMRDIAEARRLVSAYRGMNRPASESLPAALRLGIIDEETALEELFITGGEVSLFAAPAVISSLDMTLLSSVWDLLRREEARAIFRRNLSVYTGVIIEDTNGDGIPETSVEYNRGTIRMSSYDTYQTGVPELTVYFEAGDPRQARVLLAPESSGDRKTALIKWERYAAVLESELDGARYIPRPLEFYYSPLRFTNLWGSGIFFPRRDLLNPPVTRRVLVMNALSVERPSLEFDGGIEVIELSQGIPVRAREYVGNLKVSETEFNRGRPQLQRLDLDFDGRMDTVRFYRPPYREMELEELWNYDRVIDHTVTVNDWEIEW